MRLLWTSLFCIIFLVSGSLVSAAHTMAHIQPASKNVLSIDHDDEYAHHDEHNTDTQSDHHDDSHDSSEHGAELHFTVLDVTPSSFAVSAPIRSLNAPYAVYPYPTPKIPPDPYPDRA